MSPNPAAAVGSLSSDRIRFPVPIGVAGLAAFSGVLFPFFLSQPSECEQVGR